MRKNVIISNSLGLLKNGKKLILFPSRWTAATDSKSRPFAFYPYELAYLSTLLKRELPSENHMIKMVDPNILGLNQNETISYLESFKPHVLIFEISAIDSSEIFEILAHFKQKYNTIGILVGAYPSAEPEHCAEHADFSIPGEYEFTVLEILRNRAASNLDTVIPGVFPFKKDELINPDHLPWPEDNDISRLDYTEPGCDGRMIQVYASRGCPMACSFCVAPTYYRNRANTWRRRNPKDVVAEISYLAEKYKGFINGIFFNEETHNGSKEWLVDLCYEIIKNKLNYLKYDAMCIFYNFDDNLLALMREAGYHQIRVGIESFDDAVGKSMHKSIIYERIKSILEKMKSHGFVTYGTSIVGAMESTFESDLRTHNMLCDLRDKLQLLDKWQVSIATPQPGTPFFQWAHQNGYLKTVDFTKYNGRQAVLDYPNYSSVEIDKMFKIFSAKKPISLMETRSLF